MTDQERLQLIIETALKHGWTHPRIGYPDEFRIENIAGMLGVRFQAVTLVAHSPLNDLLYGDNLSLLKAAIGEGDGVNTGVRRRQSITSSIIIEGGTLYQTVAQQAVLLPDSERLQFIVDHLRKDAA